MLSQPGLLAWGVLGIGALDHSLTLTSTSEVAAADLFISKAYCQYRWCWYHGCCCFLICCLKQPPTLSATEVYSVLPVLIPFFVLFCFERYSMLIYLLENSVENTDGFWKTLKIHYGDWLWHFNCSSYSNIVITLLGAGKIIIKKKVSMVQRSWSPSKISESFSSRKSGKVCRKNSQSKHFTKNQ